MDEYKSKKVKGMKQIINFNKRKLVLETSFQFHLGIQTRIQADTPAKLGIESEFPPYENAIYRMDNALETLSKSVFTEKMNEADKKRDQILRLMQAQVESPDAYPDADEQEACKRLKILFGTYKNIANEAQEKETGMCRNLIQDLRSDAFKADATKLGLDKWIARLDEANEEFDSMVESRIGENQTKITGGASVPRRDADAAYDEIVRKINALAIVNGDEAYAAFIDYVNARIAYFKTILSHKGIKQSSNQPNNPDKPSDGGADDERPGEV